MKFFLIVVIKQGIIKSCFVAGKDEIGALNGVVETLGKEVQVLSIQRIKKSTFIFMQKKQMEVMNNERREETL